MATEERMDRLEGAVETIATETATFIKAQTDVNATITRALSTLAKSQATVVSDLATLAANVTALLEHVRSQGATVATLVEDLRSHSATIERLDQMITRFDTWLRGQGPKNGHEQ